MEEEIELKELFDTFWSKKGLIITITIIAAILGAIYSYTLTEPEYKAKTTIVLTKSDSGNNTITQSDVTLNQQLVNTYTELIKTSNVVNEVVNSLKGYNIEKEELKESIEVKLRTNTQLIEISVKNKDAELAEILTNRISEVFIEKINEIYHMDNLSIVDTAKVPDTPYNINHSKDILMFALVGMFISFVIVFIVSTIDSSIKDSDSVEKKLDITELANIPKYDKNRRHELVVQTDPKSPISEVFRMLRTNLQFMIQDSEMQTILVTSSHEGEGKSYITSNLAVSIAKEGKKVLVIDADMRKGRLNKIFKIKNTPGLSNYLSGICNVEDKDDIRNYIVPTKIENIYVLPAGDVPPNPSELLETTRLKQLIRETKDHFDIILFDGTPCLLVADSLIIAKLVDTTLIVSKYKTTKFGDIEKTKKMLSNVNAKILGFVVNQTKVSTKIYKNSYYYGKERDNRK